MFTVKQVKKGTIVRTVNTAIGTMTTKAPCKCYGVFDNAGNIVVTGGKCEMYKNEWVASDVADMLNKACK